VTEADRARQLRAVNRELTEALGRSDGRPWFPQVVEPAREPEYVDLDLRERRSQACRRFREARKRARAAAGRPATPAPRRAPTKPVAPRKASAPPRPAAVPMEPAPPARRAGRRPR